MKTSAITKFSLLSVSILFAPCLTAKAQSLYVTGQNGAIGEYTTTDGSPTGFTSIAVSSPEETALSGNDLYVTNTNNNSVGEYNATTGAQVGTGPLVANGVNGAVIDTPYGLAVSGNDLFVANFSSNTIGEFNAQTGALIDNSFISANLDNPIGLLAVGGNLYVSNFSGGNITEYDIATGDQVMTFSAHSAGGAFALATDGTTLFVSNLAHAVNTFNLLTGVSTGSITDSFGTTTGVAVVGTDLFVADSTGDNANHVDEFDLSNNNSVVQSFSVVGNPSFITVSASVPEPSTWALMLLGLGGLVIGLRSNARRNL